MVVAYFWGSSSDKPGEGGDHFAGFCQVDFVVGVLREATLHRSGAH